MKKKFIYLFFCVFISFIFIVDSNAECSYQERKDLLNATKEVKIFFEVDKRKSEFINTEDIPDYHGQDEYYLKLNVVNVTDDFFVELVNEKDATEAYYVSKDDLTNNMYVKEINNIGSSYKYIITYYSKNKNCLGKEITSTSIYKPIFNSISQTEYCNEKEFVDSEYCKVFIEKPFNTSDYDILEKMRLELNDDLSIDKSEDNTILDYLIEYYYYILIVVAIIIILFIVIIIHKKRSKL